MHEELQASKTIFNLKFMDKIKSTFPAETEGNENPHMY